MGLPREAHRLAAYLRRGGVIAYPTESCFGLGCDPRNARAVKHILRVKRRPQHKGLIVIGDTSCRLRRLHIPLPEEQLANVENSWPGPITWLLPASAKAPPWITGRSSSIALRVPGHILARSLCAAGGMPLVSTSANRSGQHPATTYREAARRFGRSVKIIPGRVGKRRRPSTIRRWPDGATVRP